MGPTCGITSLANKKKLDNTGNNITMDYLFGSDEEKSGR
jgi:hypothetical protein